MNIEVYKEVVIDNYGGLNRFNEFARVLEKKFGATFGKKLNALETAYWDFEYYGHKLTLHYHVQVGIVLYPTALKNSGPGDNEAVKKLADLLIKELL